MEYQYTGYLSTILYAPDPGAADRGPNVLIGADDLSRWPTEGLAPEKEWQGLPVSRRHTPDGVELTGRFEGEARIDNLAPDDLGFWVAMSTLSYEQPGLPVDVEEMPVVEIAYRNKTEGGVLSLVYLYEGGYQELHLPKTPRWTTAVHRLSYRGAPKRITKLILRLYSTQRATQTAEIQRVQFRAMTPEEAEACNKDLERLGRDYGPRRVPLLDDFVPLGTMMDAEKTRRLAQTLGITTEEYWVLAFEDIVRHNHNAIALENANSMTPEEWGGLLDLAEANGIRILAMADLKLDTQASDLEPLVDWMVRPYADSNALLGWSFVTEPEEHEIHGLLAAKAKVEEADPNHPVCSITRHPSAYPLLGEYFSASGTTHYTSHAPLDMAASVRVHRRLCAGQQFWVMAPAFVYATGTPEWHTCPEMRLMVNTAFANGARGWFTCAYHNDPIWVRGSYARTLTGPFLMFSDLWMELDQRMERFTVLAPLFTHAEPAPLPRLWFVQSRTSADYTELPPDTPETNSYRLRGPDYNIYFIVSNDIRGMASVDIDVPEDVMRGLQIFDITDFMSSRQWAPMPFIRHLEMFPGQARILLVAEPHVCNYWRDVLARQLMEVDRKQLRFNLQLAQQYKLDTAEVERIALAGPSGDMLADLLSMDRAHEMILDKLYASAAIVEPRTQIIEGSSIVCACDGALCRLMNRGHTDRARELGEEVLPLAREITHLRLELRQGKGEEICGHAEDVSRRARRVLERIRAFRVG